MMFLTNVVGTLLQNQQQKQLSTKTGKLTLVTLTVRLFFKHSHSTHWFALLKVFNGKVPMCYLLWEGTYATDLTYTTPAGYADFIKMAQDNKAHIIGPAISGAPNNYPEMNEPWQAYMIRKSGMINHPYSFDSYAQMAKYMGLYNYGNPTEFDDLLRIDVPATSHTTFSGTTSLPVYMDGFFTNRSEMSLLYMVENGFRGNAKLPNPFHPGEYFDNSQAPTTVPDAVETLKRLGY